MSELWALVDLSAGDFWFLAIVTFLAGMVRGFSGFALSALVMAAAVFVLPPVALLPILWFLEMSASLIMARGGWRDANRRIAVLLVLGAWIGWPIGLSLTTGLPVDQSKLVALLVILALAVLQLARVRIPGLASQPGTLIAGTVSGVVSGLAHVGGMVVALYVLALGDAARSMRGTLVLYLFLSALGSALYQLGFGVMDSTGIIRGLVFVPTTLLGVWIGTKFFSPRWERYYRPFCLGLLIVLALNGVARLVLG